MKHRISHKKINGHRLFRNIQYIRQVYLQQNIGGTISAIPMSGYDGTDVNLYNTADIGYSFDSYNITGANLTGNTFKFNKSDVTASPNWIHNVYNLTLETDNNGKLESNKNTGYYNDTASLTATPSSNYNFSGYTVTGGSINNNTFTWSDSNATVKAWFKETDPYNPLGLPPYTLRLKFSNGYNPTSRSGTWSQVSSSPNVWDWTYENSSWYNSFLDETNLIEVLGGNTTNVSDMSRLFEGCSNLTTVNVFDVHNVTNTRRMFMNCSSLTSVPLLNGSNVTDMYRMFYGCTSLTTIPLIYTNSVTTMQDMFNGCTSLTSVPLLNTSKVTTMQDMFSGCSTLTTFPLFDTKNVVNMSFMFDRCTSLTSVPLFNTSGVTDMTYMFGYCSSLTTVPLFNTSKVTDMYSMFRSCTSLTAVPSLNTSNVYRIGYMFSECSSLTTVPLFNTSKVTAMNYMFNRCNSLTAVPLLNTSVVTDMDYMLYRCTNVQNGALALYQQASTQTVPPAEHSRTFYNCGINTQTGSAELAQIPSDWK